jgi:hypothetical protein
MLIEAVEAEYLTALRANVASQTGLAIMVAPLTPTAAFIGSNLRSQRQISKQVKVRIDVATNIALGKELRSKREGAAALLEPRGGLRQMTVGWRGHDLGHGGAKVIAKPVRGSR